MLNETCYYTGSRGWLQRSKGVLATRKMATRHISIPKLFAAGDANEWFKRFEICCRANDWNEATKALKLPTLLEGEALATWLDLTEVEQQSYETAKQKIVKKMTPMGFTSLEDFHRRKLWPGEALSVFLYELRKLLEQAMPSLEDPAKKQLLLHQFMAGLYR